MHLILKNEKTGEFRLGTLCGPDESVIENFDTFMEAWIRWKGHYDGEWPQRKYWGTYRDDGK